MPDETTRSPVSISEHIGKYEILGHIASGGMGMVYLARDANLDRKVALKILPADLAKQSVTRMRFQREAKAAAQLRHENIVAIFDVGEHEGMHFIALEFVEGTDLQAYITRKCRLDPEDARTVMLQATRALVHAHEKGIVHRDIKPSNFLLAFTPEKRLIVKLTDFGLAMRHENPEEFRITRDRTTVGTVDYMSPEQARDSRSADIRSDIYSLGCTFFHMLAGVAPFARGTMPERLLQHMNAAPPDPRKLNKAVPAYLVAIIHRMLAKKPEDRYQTPAELLDHLEHPDKVPLPRKKTAAARAGRDTNYRKPGGTTAVIENREIEAESAEPAQIKTPEPSEAESEVLDNGRSTYDLHIKKKKPVAPEPEEEKEITNFGTDIEDDEDEEIEEEEDEVEEEGEEEEEDDDDEDEPKKVLQNPLVWIGGLAGTIVVLGLVLIIALAFGGRTSPVKNTDKKPTPPPIVEIIEKPKDPEEDPPPPVKIDSAPAHMTVPEFALQKLGLDPAKTDPTTLRKEYAGPFGPFPEASRSAPKVQVRRLASSEPMNYSTLHDALAKTKDGTITIDIADNGPIFVSALPAQVGRTITLRGAPGYRPLVIWDTFESAPALKVAAPLFALAQGKLILDNLDIAVKWLGDGPGTLFDLPASDFFARDCTFSIAGKSSAGIALISRTADEGPRKTQTHLQRCYVRGGDATLLSLSGVSADVLLDESLVVGYQKPIIDLRAKEPDALTLRLVRSTVTTAQMCVRWQSLQPNAAPRIQGLILDSIVSRYGPSMAQGNLLHLMETEDLSKLSWRATNSVYSGWKQLVFAGAKSIHGHDQESWRRQMKTGDSERVAEGPWPNDLPTLDELAADTFLPAQSPVGFAAAHGPGALGCVIGWLPTAPEGWFNRAFKQRLVDVITNPLGDVPRINSATDGLYHGERLDLTKIDLGAHLNGVLERMSPASRVVLHLTGRGVRETSPVRIKGIQHLVLYFETDAKDPLTLEAAPIAFKQRAPMIEMTDGHLELINARLRLSNVTFVPSLVEVLGGNLTLTGCFLQGPLVRSPDNFKHLVGASNTGATPTTLLMRNNTLVGGKTLLQLTDHVQLRARNNLFVGLGDGIQLDCATEPMALSHVLDQNTLAVRQAFFTTRTTPETPATGGPIVLHGSKNVFLTPFKDDDKPTLLRGGEVWSSHGMFTWQGRGNAYDPRLHSYFAPVKATLGRQTLKDWLRAWGPVAESEAQLLDAAAATRTLLLDNADPAGVVVQLERLALPNLGADFVPLGILKKKG